MKWPPRKKLVAPEQIEDQEALQESKTQLNKVRSRWAEVNSLVGRLGQLNGNNHYTEIILVAMRGGDK